MGRDIPIPGQNGDIMGRDIPIPGRKGDIIMGRTRCATAAEGPTPSSRGVTPRTRDKPNDRMAHQGLRIKRHLNYWEGVDRVKGASLRLAWLSPCHGGFA
jgi:hypothetical protein